MEPDSSAKNPERFDEFVN